eukprot:scaffold8296_cov305-Pinguiococcus_pyrenoidosus.AAC.3
MLYAPNVPKKSSGLIISQIFSPAICSVVDSSKELEWKDAVSTSSVKTLKSSEGGEAEGFGGREPKREPSEVHRSPPVQLPALMSTLHRCSAGLVLPSEDVRSLVVGEVKLVIVQWRVGAVVQRSEAGVDVHASVRALRQLSNAAESVEAVLPRAVAEVGLEKRVARREGAVLEGEALDQ